MRNVKIVIFLIVLLLAVLLVAYFLSSVHDKIAKVNDEVNLCWSQLQSELMRRYVNIPLMTTAIRSYTKTEEKTLSSLERAYANFYRKGGINDKVKTANEIEVLLGKIFLLSEVYPGVNSDRGFTRALAGVYRNEKACRDLRELYNKSVRLYNLRVSTFPESFFGPLFGFDAQKTLFEGISEIKKMRQKIKVKTMG